LDQQICIYNRRTSRTTRRSESEGRHVENCIHTRKGKGKAVPLQAWTGPEGSEEIKVPRFRDNDTGWW